MILPRTIRKLIAVFRGDVAPVLVLLSVMLGFWFGLTPGWYGLHVGLLVVALVLNVNVGVFVLCAAAGKAVCFAAAPVLFHVGVWTQGTLPMLLSILAAIPIVGVTDFGRCAVAGATLLGPAVGLLAGLLLCRAVVSFRRGWLKLDEGSERFRTWRSKWWVRLLDRLLIGKSAEDMRAVLTRRPRVVRVAGVGLAVLVVAAFTVALSFVDNEALARYGSEALTRANGAQVDVAALELSPAAGRLSVSDLQATDPDEPTRNRIAIDKLTADVDLWNLSRGRVVMDEVELSGVRFDAPRAEPGKVLDGRSAKAAPKPFDPLAFELSGVDVKRAAEYLENAKAAREWLAKVSEWLPAGEKEASWQPQEIPERYLEYLKARASRAPTPRLLVRRIVIDPVEIPVQQIGESTIVCTNLSDSPVAAGLPVSIKIDSKARPVSVELLGHFDRPGGGVEVNASFKDVDLAALQDKLSEKNAVTFGAGTASGTVSGTVTRDMMDLAIRVKTQGMRAESAGGAMFGLDAEVAGEAVKVLENLETTLRLVGPVTEPRLVFDGPAMGKAFRDALVKAGKDELARRADELLAGKVPGLEKPSEMIEKPTEVVGEALGGLLGGKKESKKRAETKDENASKEAKKKGPLSDLADRLKGDD